MGSEEGRDAKGVRITRMNILSLFKTGPRKMTEMEVSELRELHKVVAIEQFKLATVKGNTALLPNGQAWVSQEEALITLLENAKNQRVGQVLASCGYPQGKPIKVDLQTGKVLKP